MMNRTILLACAGCLLLPGTAIPLRAAETDAGRRVISLDGDWLFQRDGAGDRDWKTVRVPSTFESHEGTDFDGVGRYRKSLPSFELPDGKRALLHFQAAATEAAVWWDGEKLGTHLGGWTPFRFDVTDLVRKHPADASHEIRVRLDERVGHNTQGFLPAIAPHFGGIWQRVELLIVPATYIDDLALHARGVPASRRIELEVPLRGSAPGSVSTAEVRCRLRGTKGWSTTRVSLAQASLDGSFSAEGKTSFGVSIGRRDNTLRFGIDVAEPRPWSLAEPNLYELEIDLPAGAGGIDRVRTRAAFRTIEVFGEQLRLNGKPLMVRGLLNWGYYPPSLAPAPEEERFRRDLEFARSHGFNLMKFCLWVPPARILEIADELGFLTWMEYPTWHPKLTAEHLENLRREFTEFFLHDRNHPSVILRSLTCETGASAELKVIRELYEKAHAMIPGSIVEDDSSWIGWNRIHDFYDDHPYGNNDTWVEKLRGFKNHILAHGAKPLVLGEAMAADTWVDRRFLETVAGRNRPFWLPRSFDSAGRWLERMGTRNGPGGLGTLTSNSLRYALLMRKYQVEAYRREIPYGGYVISVIRDFPLASMGLLDYLGKPKWTAAEWRWHGAAMLLLATEADRRSYASGERLEADVLLSHFGRKTIEKGTLDVTVEALEAPGTPPGILHRQRREDIRQTPGTLARVQHLAVPLPDVSRPRRIVVHAKLSTGREEFVNDWPLWLVPRARAPDERPATVTVASRWDVAVMKVLRGGGRVLLLPDGSEDSPPLRPHWFLRGGPYVPGHLLAGTISPGLLVDLQPFDLASRVIPDIGDIEGIDPVLLLWDTHDLKTVKTHGLVFETRVAAGRLLVSALRHDGPTNAAGRWILDVLLDHLAAGPAPEKVLAPAFWPRLGWHPRGR